MIGRNFVLGATTLLVATQAEAAVPALDAPPITVQFSGTYFSNVANSSAALAASRGLSRDDVVYAPAVLANLVEPLGGTTFFLAGQAGYDIHQRDTILDRERIDLQAGADRYIDVCDTTLTGAWGRHQSDLADLAAGIVKNTQQTLSTTLAVSCDRLGRFVPSASVSETWFDNSAPQYFIQDFRNFVAEVGAGYNYEPIGLVSVYGEYSQSTFPHRIFVLAGGPVTDGFNLYGGGLRYSRTIGETIQLGASVGETSLVQDNGVGSNFSGVTYALNAGYTPSVRWAFNLGLSRTVNPSYYLNASYVVAEQYSGSVDYRFTSRLKASIGASDTNSKYGGAALVPGTNLLEQTYWSYYGTIGYDISPTFSVSLKAGESQRHADLVGYSYSGGYVGLALSKAF